MMNNREETLIPKIGVITDVRIDTPDIKTFRVVTPEGGKVFEHRPGQCAMLSIPGVGEAMFSITSSPTNTEYMESPLKNAALLLSGCIRLKLVSRLPFVDRTVNRSRLMMNLQAKTCYSLLVV